MKREDKEAIPLSIAVPLILRPRMFNLGLGYDNLELEAPVCKKLDEQSWAATERGPAVTNALVYVDADELPAGLRPNGSYRIEGNLVRVTIRLIHNCDPVLSFEVEGSVNNPAELANKIVDRIGTEIKKVPAQPLK